MADIFDLFKRIEKEKKPPEPLTHIIAGLGNPGDKYARTRHNAGFLAIDYLAEKSGFLCKRLKFKSLTGEAEIGGKRVLVMKPQTYMNCSGEAIGAAAEFYNIPPEKIIIIVDDIALVPGAMRIRAKGSDGGHNGLKSIIYHLESNQFPRIRLGVGEKPTPDTDLAGWVLGSFSREDIEDMMPCFEACLDACALIINGKTEEAMSKYNGLRPKGNADE